MQHKVYHLHASCKGLAGLAHSVIETSNPLATLGGISLGWQKSSSFHCSFACCQSLTSPSNPTLSFLPLTAVATLHFAVFPRQSWASRWEWELWRAWRWRAWHKEGQGRMLRMQRAMHRCNERCRCKLRLLPIHPSTSLTSSLGFPLFPVLLYLFALEMLFKGW